MQLCPVVGCVSQGESAIVCSCAPVFVTVHCERSRCYQASCARLPAPMGRELQPPPHVVAVYPGLSPQRLRSAHLCPWHNSRDFALLLTSLERTSLYVRWWRSSGKADFASRGTDQRLANVPWTQLDTLTERTFHKTVFAG